MKRTFVTTASFYAAWLLAIGFIASTLLGAVNHYTNVPLHDMWNSYVMFNIQAEDGDLSVWWAQHNEHRIVLSRMLFWIDAKVFGESVAFLIVVNVLLQFAMLATALFILFKSCPREYSSVFTPFVICWMLFWSQNENLTWGFQSQFYLAYLLPIGAFLTFSNYIENGTKSSLYLACILGVGSAMSMANGVLALPLLAFFSIRVGAGWRASSAIAMLALATNVLYFSEYTTPTNHSSLVDTISNSPKEFMVYIGYYFGSPFYHMLVYLPDVGKALALMMGMVFLAASSYFGLRNLFGKNIQPFELALTCFLLYLGGTAVATAGGRVIFGIDQAFSARYTTPVLFGWVVLVGIWFRACEIRIPRITRLVLLFIVVLMLPLQSRTLLSVDNFNHQRHTAVAALAWQVRDAGQISYVFPFPDWALEMARIAVDRDRSIFKDQSLSNYSQIRLDKETGILSNASKRCAGHIDSVTYIPAIIPTVKFSGWLGDVFRQNFVNVYDENGDVLGSAATKGLRNDVGERVSPALRLSGITGYAQVRDRKNLLIYNADYTCSLQIPLAAEPFRLLPDRGSTSAVDMAAILNSSLVGSDYLRSRLEGFKVLGSYASSDADLGEVSLRISRGDSLKFITGPSVSSLSISIDGEVYQMPSATSWSELVFDDISLPHSFEVVLKDSGTSWGEWFAIGLVEK